MEAKGLIDRLNGCPMWVRLDDPRTNAVVYKTIADLAELFQHVGADERRAIASELGRSAKYAMAEYSRHKAVEGRQTHSASAILQGLIPVVMASGESSTPTGGFLLSILLRSALSVGLDAQQLFAHAAQFATDKAVAERVCGFPLLPPAERDIARFGVREKMTPAGVVYEQVAESPFRVGWWGKLMKWRGVSREDALDVLRRIEKEHGPPKS